MALRLDKFKQVETVDLGKLGLPSAEREWISQRIGDTPRVDDIDTLLLAPDLTPDERRIVTGLKLSLTGDTRSQRGEVMSSGGSASLGSFNALTLRTALAATGELPAQRKLREEMPNALVGHADQLEPFVRLLKEFQSPTRRTAPLITLVGEVGHGKDQALVGYAQSVYGPNAEPHRVDLRDFTDNDTPKLFGAEGALGSLALAELSQRTAESRAKPPPKKKEEDEDPLAPAKKEPPVSKNAVGVIQITGAQDLLKNKPKIAAQLSRLLDARRGETGYYAVHYVLDFDVPSKQDPRKLLIDAVGASGNRNLCSTAAFSRYDASFMLQYARPVVAGILSDNGLAKLKLEFDDDAAEVLGKVLATPYAPLDEIEQRLQRFLFTHFDTQTSVDRARGVLRVSLSDRYKADKQSLNDLIVELHKEYPDLFLGEDLFVVHEVARQVDGKVDLEASVEAARELTDPISDAALECAAVKLRSKEAKEALAPVTGAIMGLQMSYDDVLNEAEQNAKLSVVPLISHDTQSELSDQIDRLTEGLDALAAGTHAELTSGWREPLVAQIRELANALSDAALELSGLEVKS